MSTMSILSMGWPEVALNAKSRLRNRNVDVLNVASESPAAKVWLPACATNSSGKVLAYHWRASSK